ncbi:unnamed protein product [Macrosiphum euphorbiae]|uniref:Secreted protein n=1 Tax=Macrosiphum euphorbiae TaxID=13131 RepID=A0AAV0WXY6_9HEMI|nr:unnamed protein product [Macrosiphum euphorbiae]
MLLAEGPLFAFFVFSTRLCCPPVSKTRSGSSRPGWLARRPRVSCLVNSHLMFWNSRLRCWFSSFPSVSVLVCCRHPGSDWIAASRGVCICSPYFLSHPDDDWSSVGVLLLRSGPTIRCRQFR